MSRATHDRGRLGFMWDNGLFGRVPAVIDHATVSVETEGNAWSVFMRDVSSSLVAPDARFDRGGVLSVLDAMRRLHEACWPSSSNDASRPSFAAT